MPEHRCRIREPSDFQPESFRRIVQGKLGIVIGKLTGKTTTTTQAFRYPTDKWTLESARNHCNEHEGKFDPSTEERLTDTNVDRIAETNARHAAIRMYARKFNVEMTEDDLNKPFGIYDNMDECISLNLDKPDPLEFCMNVKQELEAGITQNPEVKPLPMPVQESNKIRIFETVNSLIEAMHGNKFKWIPDIDRLKEVSRSSNAKLILVTALHEMTTDPKNKGHGAREFSKNELMKSVYTALGKGLNINHDIPLNKNFTHKILDGDYNEADDSLEYILMDDDPEILRLIRDEYITSVSMQGDPRRQPTKCDKCGTKDCNCRMHPEAIIWGEKDGIAMAYVVTKEGATYHGQPIQAEKPGDPKSRITIMETIEERSYVASGSLSDSDFAYVPAGEHALSARKLPIFTKDRTVTSLRRFAVTVFPNDAAKSRTRTKLCEAAKKFGITSDLCESSNANKSLKDTERTNQQMNTRELLLTLTQDAKVKESIEHPDKIITEQTDLDLYNKALEEGNTVDAYNIISGYTHPEELEAMLSEELVEAVDEQGTVRIQPITQPLRSQFPAGTGRGRFLFSPTRGARLFPTGLTVVEKIKEKLIAEAKKKVGEKTGQIEMTEEVKKLVAEITKKVTESMDAKVKEILEKEGLLKLKESMQNLSSQVKETMQEAKKKVGNLPVHTLTETLHEKGKTDQDTIERNRNILRTLTQ